MDTKIEPSKESFTFGDANNHKAIRRINFTCWVGGKSADITADIVDLIIAFIMKIDGGISGSPLTLAIFKNLL